MSEESARCLRTVLGGLSVREALDVGCGNGSFTRTLARALGSRRSIVGIDPDKDSIDEARRLTTERSIRFRVLSGAQMPFYDGRFDLVAISNALHHLDEPARVLDEMRRVAAPEGLLVVQEVVADGLSPAEQNGRDVHHLKAWIDRLRGRTHRPTMSRGEVRDVVRAAGARVEAECEIREETPASPDAERVAEALSFLAEYREFARDTGAYDDIVAEVERISASLAGQGIADPPRILIRARFPHSS